MLRRRFRGGSSLTFWRLGYRARSESADAELVLDWKAPRTRRRNPVVSFRAATPSLRSAKKPAFLMMGHQRSNRMCGRTRSSGPFALDQSIDANFYVG